MDSRIRQMGLSRQFDNKKQKYLSLIEQVCTDNAYCDGKYVAEFEKNFASYHNIPGASCVNNGTNALFLALKALGITCGDEVIIQSMTFVADAWAVVYCGATPVFADSLIDTWEMDAKSVEEKITPKTKAIICTHLYGQPCDMDCLTALAEKYNLFLIEDCAQSHGAVYKNKTVGTIGDMGCFSFYPTKNLGAFGEGGCVIAKDKKYTDKISSLKKHSPAPDGDHTETGFNMRMEGIQAAVLNEKLKYLNESNEKRIEIADVFNREIINPKIVKQKNIDGVKNVYHLYVVTVDDRKKFMEYMDENQIDTSIHYPMPCHLMTAFKNLGYKKGDLKNSEYIAEHCVSIPIYPELTNEETERIISACNKF